MALKILFGINLILSVVYVIYAKPKKDKLFGIFFILVPYLGFVIHYLPLIAYKISKKSNFYEKSNVILHIEPDNIIQKPVIEEELNIISIDSAITACTPQEKRSLLLNVLKNDMIKSASDIKNALKDTDSETAHYAATATIETYKKLKANIQNLESSLTEDFSNHLLRRELLTAIDECINSNVLTRRDNQVYMLKFIHLFDQCFSEFSQILNCDDYIHKADFQLKLKLGHDALDTAISAIKKFNNESAYYKALEICYSTRNQKKFNEILDNLTGSQISVSNQLLELIRFWNLRCE